MSSQEANSREVVLEVQGGRRQGELMRQASNMSEALEESLDDIAATACEYTNRYDEAGMVDNKSLLNYVGDILKSDGFIRNKQFSPEQKAQLAAFDTKVAADTRAKETPGEVRPGR